MLAKKDQFYVTGLLHDIGRVAQYETGEHHSVAGVRIAEKLLTEIEYPSEWMREPTLKISTNTPLAEKKSGWIDFNTGVIADGEKSIDEAAKDLLDLVIRVASGEQTKAEKHGFREISIFKDGVVL